MTARETLAIGLAVALGSLVGGVLRAAVSLAALAWLGSGFPWGTLAVNLVGSLVIGWFAALAGPNGTLNVGLRQRQFVMAGLCGGFTTFSAFSLETLQLLQEARPAAAGLYISLSVATWLGAVWLGDRLGRRRSPA